jgi:hypothetical protein
MLRLMRQEYRKASGSHRGDVRCGWGKGWANSVAVSVIQVHRHSKHRFALYEDAKDYSIVLNSQLNSKQDS